MRYEWVKNRCEYALDLDINVIFNQLDAELNILNNLVYKNDITRMHLKDNNAHPNLNIFISIGRMQI